MLFWQIIFLPNINLIDTFPLLPHSIHGKVHEIHVLCLLLFYHNYVCIPSKSFLISKISTPSALHHLLFDFIKKKIPIQEIQKHLLRIEHTEEYWWLEKVWRSKHMFTFFWSPSYEEPWSPLAHYSPESCKFPGAEMTLILLYEVPNKRK